MRKFMSLFSLVLLPLVLFACGGGGGGGSAGGDSADSTVITGVASKGPLNMASIRVHAVNTNGSIGSLLGSTTTDESGNYSVTISSHTGPVVVSASGGTYINEATGQTSTIPAEAPLRAAVVLAGAGSSQVAVTAITELAVRLAAAAVGGFSATNIAEANDNVSRQFGFNVVTTQPVAPTASAIAGAGGAAANYTCALATLSQQAHDASKSVKDLISALVLDLNANNGRFSRDTLNAFDQASVTFFRSDNLNNTTGLTAPPTNNALVGRTPFTLHLAVTGTSTPVGGVLVTLTLPSGVSLATGGDGQPANGVVNVSGTVSGGVIMPNYTPETVTARATLVLAMATEEDFVPGEFATVTADIPGLQLPAAGNFTVSNISMSSGTGENIAGEITLAVTGD